MAATHFARKSEDRTACGRKIASVSHVAHTAKSVNCQRCMLTQGYSAAAAARVDAEAERQRILRVQQEDAAAKRAPRPRSLRAEVAAQRRALAKQDAEAKARREAAAEAKRLEDAALAAGARIIVHAGSTPADCHGDECNNVIALRSTCFRLPDRRLCCSAKCATNPQRVTKPATAPAERAGCPDCGGSGSGGNPRKPCATCGGTGLPRAVSTKPATAPAVTTKPAQTSARSSTLTASAQRLTRSKHCPRCNCSKLALDWNRNATSADGLARYCRACERDYGREWRAARKVAKEAIRERMSDLPVAQPPEAHTTEAPAVVAAFRKAAATTVLDVLARLGIEVTKDQRDAVLARMAQARA